MKFEIKHRYSGAVLFELECGSLRICLEAAVKAHADLANAYLAGAYLTNADLAGAYLAGAYLTNADLANADLANADLAGADLANAYLANAYLAGADLTNAYLANADLTNADLANADLANAYLAIKQATKNESIAALDKIREIILDKQDRLDMGHWHESDEWQKRTCAEEILCETTHCMAGWLQVCSTDPKIRKLPTNVAGVICAPVAAKMFYHDDEEVLEWLRDRKYVADAEEAEKQCEERQAKREAKS